MGAIDVLKSLMSGPGGLDEAAIVAVKQWKFSPATNGGRPLATWITLDVTFNLEDEKEIRKLSTPVIYDNSSIIVNNFMYPEFMRNSDVESTIVVEVEIELFRGGSIGATDIKCLKIVNIDDSIIDINKLTKSEIENYETTAINEILLRKFTSAVISKEITDVWLVVNVEFRSRNSRKMDNMKISREIGKTPKRVIFDVHPSPITKIPAKFFKYSHRPINKAVKLEVEIFEDGTVGDIKVLKSLMSSHLALDEAAINAVKQWEFTPAYKDGKPVATWIILDVYLY